MIALGAVEGKIHKDRYNFALWAEKASILVDLDRLPDAEKTLRGALSISGNYDRPETARGKHEREEFALLQTRLCEVLLLQKKNKEALEQLDQAEETAKSIKMEIPKEWSDLRTRASE